MPNTVPMSVTIGMSELRSTCTGMTRRRGSPLPYAVRTQSWPIVSIVDARVSRILVAYTLNASVIAGRSSPSQPLFDPTVGSAQPSWTPMKYCAKKPTTKTGTATKTSANTSIAWSNHVFLKNADSAPITMARMNAIATASTARRNVTGNVRASTSMTSCPLNVVPKSRRKMPPR